MPARRGFAVGCCFHLVGSFHFCFSVVCGDCRGLPGFLGPMRTGRAFTSFQKEKAPGIAKKCGGTEEKDLVAPAPRIRLCNHAQWRKFKRTCAAKYPWKRGNRSKPPTLPALACGRSPATWEYRKTPCSPARGARN